MTDIGLSLEDVLHGESGEQAYNLRIWKLSSVGSSTALLRRVSRVRVPDDAPIWRGTQVVEETSLEN